MYFYYLNPHALQTLESRRHKIEKAKYRVTNWLEYNAALRKRGDFTVYFTEDAIDSWHSQRPVSEDVRKNIRLLPSKQA